MINAPLDKKLMRRAELFFSDYMESYCFPDDFDDVTAMLHDFVHHLTEVVEIREYADEVGDFA